jgi:general secretion pathway protein K
MLIKGITPELYYGDDEKPGMSKYITVHGVAGSGNAFNFPGRINVSTAEAPVLAALMPEGSEDLIETMLDFRQQAMEDKESHDFSSPG